MKQKQYILHSWVIEVIAVLLASMIAFQVCNIFGIRMSLLPFIMATGYVILKLMYHLCITVARYIIEAIPPSFLISVKKRDCKKTLALTSFPISNCEEVQKKRMELFHYEYQREQQQYQWQKEREEDEKLNAILRYTRDTFKRFDLEETEIYQICESVRYLVINRQVLSATEIHIKKRTSLTQISLKNFAWNIAFQYNIGRDMTTSFVMATFSEWFANSTFDTVRKNLRTTTGRHKIEIDENILSKYAI
ncbi:hypothetical protein K6V26_02065 [Parabacteroides goldsteinii]|uniref:hypothetical protein n=1 Tax=Parabacteroides goldsteinii TaxID=328812 RepID=UPI001CCB80FE|nr:hypothetical protein [Parabacteroides goldsteinii]UBD75172.1 hypothetical protein K6V26_02065 [Parabacteroides goldsteinii]